MTFGSSLILSGMALVVTSQIAMAVHAFTGNPFKGILCLVIPGYLIVYTKKHNVGVWFMRAWYAGIAVFVFGGILAS